MSVFNRHYAEDSGIMAIHTGLSVTIVGHLIELERDEERRVAKLVVRVIDGHTVTGLEADAVMAAGLLLQARAKRFLGQNWTVVGLSAQQLAARVG